MKTRREFLESLGAVAGAAVVLPLMVDQAETPATPGGAAIREIGLFDPDQYYICVDTDPPVPVEGMEIHHWQPSPPSFTFAPKQSSVVLTVSATSLPDWIMGDQYREPPFLSCRLEQRKRGSRAFAFNGMVVSRHVDLYDQMAQVEIAVSGLITEYTTK